MAEKILGKMGAKLVPLTLFILMISYVASVEAQPGAPHQFFGSVTVNGRPAADGLLVVAKIDGQEVAGTTTENGAYGLLPNLFNVPDPHGNRYGKTIEFYVSGSKGGEEIFHNGFSTELSLSVTGNFCGDGNCAGGETCSSCRKDCGKCSSDGGTGGTPPTPPSNASASEETQCTENWECSGWFECFNSIRKRVCTDLNDCGTTENKPEETRTCVDISLCTEDWSCTEWSPCQSDATQARVCTDANKCRTTENKPAESRSCGYTSAGAGISGFFLSNPATGFGLVIVLIIAIVTGLVYWKVRKK